MESKSHNVLDGGDIDSCQTSLGESVDTIKMEKNKINGLPRYITAGVLVFACYGLFYGPSLLDLVWDWFTYISFSYCAVIPLMSLYLVWGKRNELAKTPLYPSFSGLCVLIAALMIALLGKSIGESIAVRVSMVLSIAGLLQLTLGTSILRAVTFPVTYLLLMIPFPYSIVKEVAYYLRMFDAIAAANALRIIGIPVYRDAHFLHLPNISLEVADLCSGISSVFALFALGVYYVYFLPMGVGRKVLAVLSTVPFATAVNLLRIIITSVSAYYMGPVALGYLVHELTGTITFFIALGLFVSMGELLVRRGLPKKSQLIDGKMKLKEKTIRTSTGPFDRNQQATRGGLAILASCSVLLLASYVSLQLETVRGVPLLRALDTIPPVIASFNDESDQPIQRYHDPEVEKEVSRIYVDDSRAAIEMYVGFNSYQTASRRLASPKLHLISGWEIASMESGDFKPSQSSPERGVWLTLQNGSGKQIVLYWYQVGANTFASEIDYRVHQFKRMILESRADAAIVRLATPILNSESADAAKRRLQTFASTLYPLLQTILPR